MSVLNAVLQTLNSLKLDGSNADGISQGEPENLETAVSVPTFCCITCLGKAKSFLLTADDCRESWPCGHPRKTNSDNCR